MALVSAAAVAMSTIWLLRVTTRGVAAGCALLLAMLPGILGQTHMVLSEIPFWGLAMVALWAFVRYEAEEAERPARWLMLAAIATALAWVTRSAGIALAVALVARLLLLRRWRDALVFGGLAALPAALWSVRGRLLGSHGYADHLMMRDPYRPDLGRIGVLELIPRALDNALEYLLGLGPAFIAGTPKLARYLAFGLLVLAVARWAWLLVRRRGATELWMLFYGGLVLIWPQTWAGERFLVPLAPALLFYAGDAARVLYARADARSRGAFAAVALLVALSAVVPGAVRTVRLGIKCRSAVEADQQFPCMAPIWRSLYEVAVLSRGRLPEDAVVLTRKPTLFFDLSGYRSSTYPWSADPDVFFGLADSVGAEYVVLDRAPDTAELYLMPVLGAHPSVFCVIQEMSREGAVMLRIDFDGARALVQDGAPGVVRFRLCESVS